MIVEKVVREVVREMDNEVNAGPVCIGYDVFSEGEDDWRDILAFLKSYYPDKDHMDEYE